MSTLNSYQLAALASDAYHRGYHPFMPETVLDNNPDNDDGLGSATGTSVAGGVILATSADLGADRRDVAADFYAVAYLIDGEVVISYRGSDNLYGADAPRVNAFWNGQTPDQLLLALEFFNYVEGICDGAPITLTGHSLGGALAGAVANLKNAEAVIFNNIAFTATAANVARTITSDQADFDQTLYDLVYNGADTPWSTFGTGNISAIALDGDIAGLIRVMQNAEIIQMGTWLWPWEAHSMAQVILALQVREQYGVEGDWIHAANTVFNQLNNNTLAEYLGYEERNGNPISGVMKDQIASTLLPGNDNPYGSSAALSLTNDMQDLGLAATSAVNMTAMATLIVQYAALQAKNDISNSNDGFLAYDNGSRLLSADLTQEKWTFDGNPGPIPGVGRDFSNYLDDKSLSLIERVNLDLGPGRFEYEYYSNALGGWQGQVAHEAGQFYVVRAVGTDTLDTIIGTNGDEQILLGGGNDQVKANGGVNWIDGGEGDDKLIDDNAWSKFEIAKDGGRYYFALRDSGTDPRIHVLDSMELFRLDGVEFDASNILNAAPTGIGVESIGGSTTAGLAQGTYGIGASIIDLCALDLNVQDTFTWQILGNAANLYDISSAGVVTTKAAATYDYATWRGAVGSLTYEQWQENLGDYAALADSKYCFTVEVTDSYGYSWLKDIALFLEPGAGSLVGTPNNDTLVGGTGRTIIAGLGGADTITDNDWVVLDYSASNAGVNIAKHASVGSRMVGTGGHAQGDVISMGRYTRLDIIGSDYGDVLNGTSIESPTWGWMLNGDNAIFAGGGNDIINAGSGTNWLYGGDGNDTITGGSGYDAIYGGDGYDIINAGGGNNYVDFGAGGGELKLPDYYHAYYGNLETREFRYLNGQAGTTTTVVGDFNKLTGSNYDDELYGSSGNDIIYGGGGPADKIWGLGGDDYLEGGGTLYGGDNNDTIALKGAGSAWGQSGEDILSSSVTYTTLIGGADNDRLTSTTSNVTLVGGIGADIINGLTAQNKWNTVSYEWAAEGVGLTYNGSSGSGWAGEAMGDVLNGNFSFRGSAFADEMNVTLMPGSYTELRAGAGNDILNVSLHSGYLTVYGDGMSYVPGTEDDDVITNSGTSGTIYGGRGNDTISGAGTLYGDAGMDIITSGSGSQSIYLGADTDVDTFVFSRMQGFDRIFDFTSIDRIDIGAGYKYDDFGDILANSQQVGANVDIWFESNMKITILNYSLSSLTAANFEFV